MSNYPPPYPGPPAYPSPYAGPPVGYYPPPPAAGTGAARRAGLLMFILGPMVLLLGGCFVCVAAALPTMAQQSPQQVDNLRAQMSLPSGFSMETFMAVAGVVVAVPGIVLLTLAAFVRRGRRWAVITSLVVAGLILMWLALNVLASLVHAASGGPNLMGGCVGVVVAAAFGLLVAWLIAALRAGPGAGDPYQQYLAQYYYQQQVAQSYAVPPGPTGYGYGVPPLPPAAPPPPSDPV
jgi:hypothetical protein